MDIDDQGRGDDVYQPDGSEVQDDEGLLDQEDTLLGGGVTDPLDQGYSPPERPWGVEHTGVTCSEQRLGGARRRGGAPGGPPPGGGARRGRGAPRGTPRRPRPDRGG
ncbi:hypothetical protein ACFCWG_40845, partial [Streptomyces sp. NPDC056390]